ncbi:Cyclic nucleotide gated channel 5 isoform 1 [Hibiscus syriacus]|uniref:Cyclic nucleotide gated channel 5 isoform 1 n=1 Tax=Hibiscus syriacus TaxID=106335 RepID=A0A6A3A8Z4_HIBSY|nr:Cyclic nucleotide gated channel 5 isoform 1 [Hibiscus syriacus]
MQPRVVAKSELTGAGMPEDSYSLSEVKLSSKVRGKKSSAFYCQAWASATVAPFFKIEYEGLENLPSHDAPAECLKRCMDLIRNGASVFFFPEGTRSKEGKLGDFKKGAFSVAAKTGAPVIPITLIGTGRIMPAGMEGVVNSGSVKVIIHKPIEETDPEILRQVARNTILDTLKRRG